MSKSKTRKMTIRVIESLPGPPDKAKTSNITLVSGLHIGRPLRIEYPDVFDCVTARGSEQRCEIMGNLREVWGCRVGCIEGKLPNAG